MEVSNFRVECVGLKYLPSMIRMAGKCQWLMYFFFSFLQTLTEALSLTGGSSIELSGKHLNLKDGGIEGQLGDLLFNFLNAVEPKERRLDIWKMSHKFKTPRNFKQILNFNTE